jgi:hypothetical protein
MAQQKYNDANDFDGDDNDDIEGGAGDVDEE